MSDRSEESQDSKWNTRYTGVIVANVIYILIFALLASIYN